MAVSVLMKPSSGMCNLHCDYCFYCDEMQKRKQESYGFMSLDTLRSIIKKTVLNTREPVAFAYQGGEPTLRGLPFYKAAVAWQKKYNHQGAEITNAFQTNGILLDEAWCRFFQENHFLVGISIDGVQATHDRFRHTADRQPVYDQVLAKTRLLDQCHVDYNILTVVNAATAENIDAIYQSYQKNGWRYQQYIPCLDPLDAPHGTAAYSLSPEAYGRFLIRLFQLWQADWQQQKQPSIRWFDNLIQMMLGDPPEACEQRGICGQQYVVEADGSVYPCDFYMLDEYRLGNFNTDQLADLDAHRRQIGFVERSMQVADQCRQCRWRSLCRGGCQRMRDRQADGLYRNVYCESYQAFFAACLPQLNEIVRRIQAGRQ